MKQIDLSDERGASLIAVSILVLVLSLMVSAAIMMYKHNKIFINSEETKTRLAIIEQALERYYENATPGTQHLPCPAQLSALPDTANFGRANCGLSISANGQRDGVTIPNGVVIGTVPVRTLGLKDDYMLDGWDRRIVYAVTTSYTAGGVDITADNGAIDLRDSNNNSVTHNKGSVIYTLLSSGEDDRGAYDYNGTLLQACSAGSDAGENCDMNDGVFYTSLLRNYNMSEDLYTSRYAFLSVNKLYRWVAHVNTNSCSCGGTKTTTTYVCEQINGGAVTSTMCTQRMSLAQPQAIVVDNCTPCPPPATSGGQGGGCATMRTDGCEWDFKRNRWK